MQGGNILYPSLFFPYPSPFFSFSPISLFSSLHPAFPPRPAAKRPLKSRYRGHGIALSSASGGRAGASGVRGGGPAATASNFEPSNVSGGNDFCVLFCVTVNQNDVIDDFTFSGRAGPCLRAPMAALYVYTKAAVTQSSQHFQLQVLTESRQLVSS